MMRRNKKFKLIKKGGEKMTKRYKLYCGILLATIMGICMMVEKASAIPVFARKYGTSCTTCHSPVPININNFGQAFKNNGYRMPANDEAFVKQADQELGAQAWKDMWPNAVYPGAIPSQIPLSFQIYLDARYNEKDDVKGTPKTPKIWFDVPHELELMSAGTLGKNFSFWGNVEFKGDEKDKATLEIVQAWGQIDHIFDTTMLNFKIGRIEPGVVPFSRVTRRSLAHDFITSEFSPLSQHNFKTMQAGIEVWGVQSVVSTGGGFQYALGTVNGEGKGPTDSNQSLDGYYRLAYKFGGFGVGESLQELGELNQSENWIDNSLRIGTYGYVGAWGGPGTKFSRFGFDLDWWVSVLNIFGTAWLGNDAEIQNSGLTRDVKSLAWFVQGNYILYPWLTGVLRYEMSHQEDKSATRRILPAVIIAIRPNITWTTEYAFYQEVDTKKSGDDILRTRVRFIF